MTEQQACKRGLENIADSDTLNQMKQYMKKIEKLVEIRKRLISVEQYKAVEYYKQSKGRFFFLFKIRMCSL